MSWSSPRKPRKPGQARGLVQLTLAAVFAVVLVVAAIDAAGTVWAYPIGIAAGAFGCLLVALEGDLR